MMVTTMKSVRKSTCAFLNWRTCPSHGKMSMNYSHSIPSCLDSPSSHRLLLRRLDNLKNATSRTSSLLAKKFTMKAISSITCMSLLTVLLLIHLVAVENHKSALLRVWVHS
jgi:hypothetical protein